MAKSSPETARQTVAADGAQPFASAGGSDTSAEHGGRSAEYWGRRIGQVGCRVDGQSVSATSVPSVADLEAKASGAVAIEALWDGDTQGWSVELFAVIRAQSGYSARHLHSFRFGGDMRIFNGQVPPWPEAAAASRAGADLAAALGIPFHFPSPIHPEDDCPRWWERDSGRLCARCREVLLLQRADCRWPGVCYHCHLALEREKRDAQFPEEERRGPRCSMCGDPATGDVGNPARCSRCREKYRDSKCPSCDVMMTRHVDHITSDYCGHCVMAQRLSTLSAHERRRLREAASHGIRGLIAVQKLLDCGLGDAQYALAVAAEFREDES